MSSDPVPMPERFNWSNVLGRLFARSQTRHVSRCACCGAVLDSKTMYDIADLGSFCHEMCAEEYTGYVSL